MKTYIKPTIDFINLKPDERLACNTSGNNCDPCNLLESIIWGLIKYLTCIKIKYPYPASYCRCH
jgi:hypothetical protein